MVERRRTRVERQLAENGVQPDRRSSVYVWTNFWALEQCVEYQRDAFIMLSMGISPVCGKGFSMVRESPYGSAEKYVRACGKGFSAISE